MNDTKETNSDSELGSNSSWTILVENQENPELKSNQSEIFLDVEKNDSEDALAESPSVEIINDNSGGSNDGDKKLLELGCLTLEEFLKERELTHDYAHDEKTAPKKKEQDQSKSKRKKCKAEELGIIVIIGTILAVAGVSLLCLLAPKNNALTSQDFQKIQNDFEKAGIYLKPHNTTICDSDRNGPGRITKLNNPPERTFKKGICSKTDDHFGPLTYDQYLRNVNKNVDLLRNCNLTPRQQTALQLFNRIDDKIPCKTKPFSSTPKKPTPSKMITFQPKPTPKNQSPKLSEEIVQFHASQNRIMCDFFQDLVLLEVISEAAKRLDKKSKTASPKEKKPKRKRGRKLSKSKVALKLLDELPFSKRYEPPPKGAAKFSEQIHKAQKSGGVVQESTLTEGLGRFADKQSEFYRKIREEERGRMDYLRRAREKQDEAIRALVTERKSEYNRFKDASCGKYQVPLPKASEVQEKVKELQKGRPRGAASFDFFLRPEGPKMATDVAEAAKVRDFDEARIRYFERAGSYKAKQEEFLAKQMGLMDQISDAIKEIMGNYRNNQRKMSSDDLNTVDDVLTQVVAVFPEDSGLLKSKTDFGVYMGEEDVQGPSNAASFIKTATPENAKFVFCASECPTNSSNNFGIKDDSFYAWLFGRKGRDIRRRDVSVWCFDRVSKRKHVRESSCPQNDALVSKYKKAKINHFA